MKHKRADLIMAYAVEAQTSETPWDIFEESLNPLCSWHPCIKEPVWGGPCNYRLKPKTPVIDWNKVNYDIVPVRAENTQHVYYHEPNIGSRGLTLVTGKQIAWTGGDCPLPEGVVVECVFRDYFETTILEATELKWTHDGAQDDIIWVEVVGLGEGYSWGEVPGTLGTECWHGVSGEPCPDCIKEYHEDELVMALKATIAELRKELDEANGVIR